MTNESLKLGWAEIDITPPRPVPLAGSFSTRISEGIHDPLSVTAWVIEAGMDQAVFVSCDLTYIPDELRDAVRAELPEQATGLDPMKVILHATHTHYAPEVRVPSTFLSLTSAGGIGVDLNEINAEAMSVEEYVAYVTKRIAMAIVLAWTTRTAGGIAFGLGYAVIGRNRRWVNVDGRSTMHGLNASTAEGFRHVEGYEDHSLHLMATYDSNNNLTGLIVNFACPAQSPNTASSYEISADFWYETRSELRRKFGEKIFILPQCSFAGDQTATVAPVDKLAAERMFRLSGRTKRQEIAQSIVHAVEDILPAIQAEISTGIPFRHQVETVNLRATVLTEDDVRTAIKNADEWQLKYDQEKEKLAKHPELRAAPRWYNQISISRRNMQWHRNVVNRFAQQQENPTFPVEIHILRLGEVVFASVPFEYFLDYGIQIKLRSPAIQTFLVQLAGGGMYVPSPRSLVGGGYSGNAANNPLHVEVGQQLAEYMVTVIQAVWQSAHR